MMYRLRRKSEFHLFTDITQLLSVFLNKNIAINNVTDITQPLSVF
jgi:hypothetical protein